MSNNVHPMMFPSELLHPSIDMHIKMMIKHPLSTHHSMHARTTSHSTIVETLTYYALSPSGNSINQTLSSANLLSISMATNLSMFA